MCICKTNFYIFAPVSNNQAYTELTRAIRGAGYSPQDFAKNVLNVSYQGFMYRVREKKLTLDQYHKIMAYTGKSFEELWPNPYQPKKRIPLTFHQPSPIRATPSKEIKEPVPVVPAPAPDFYDGEKSFSVIDVYDNGLPPVEWTFSGIHKKRPPFPVTFN